jgi:hypothetical protein
LSLLFFLITFLSLLVHLYHTLFLFYCLVLFASQLKMQMPNKHPFFCVLGRIFFGVAFPPMRDRFSARVHYQLKLETTKSNRHAAHLNEGTNEKEVIRKSCRCVFAPLHHILLY